MTNSFLQLLQGVEIILASGSPRRKTFLEDLGIPFRVQTHEVDENYPPELEGAAIAEFIVQQKMKPFAEKILPHQLVIAADTVVWKAPHCLGKPKNKTEAKEMLQLLSGTSHEVITAIGLAFQKQEKIICESSMVYFKPLSEETIEHYIEQAQPFDKAGAYGIQEWIGWVAVEKIEGSYTNIVGLPTTTLVESLTTLLTNRNN